MAKATGTTTEETVPQKKKNENKDANVPSKEGDDVMKVGKKQKWETQHVRKSKRMQKPTPALCSPYVERLTSCDKVKAEELNLYKAILSSNKDEDDFIWEMDDVEQLTIGHASYFQVDVPIHWAIIDCWAAYLNILEKFKSAEAPARLFFHTHMMSDMLLNETNLEFNRLGDFIEMMNMYIPNWEVKANLIDVALVIFPIIDGDKYYMLCFDLKEGNSKIIDHIKRKGTVDRIYGPGPRIVQKIFCHWLATVYHPQHIKLMEDEPSIMKMEWKVNQLGPNYGIYLMRHMESYRGEVAGKWKTEVNGKQRNDSSCIGRLRYRYMYNLLTSDYNLYRDKVLTIASKFAKMDVYKKAKLVDEKNEMTRKNDINHRRSC
ncbi:hypothetical protein L2E82_13188 [Cichorium intybus]|uniref:Uncharacterized protein n=1 Tax=Cichorium intybus TaxID=13427 RepID=A0ACB9GJC7_CICIN|nr:hypothetical protein L2E82_13188 [Cichorium intybus]